MSRKYVLMLGGSRAQEFLRAAERRDLGVLILTTPELLEGSGTLPPCVVHSEAVDFNRQIPLVQRILELHRSYPLAGIVPVLEYGLEMAAVAANRLGLPTNSISAVRNTRDKLLMRQVLRRAGLESVRFAQCRSAADAERFLAEVGGPIFIKPAAGTASDGVGRIDEPSQVAEAFSVAAGSLAGARLICEEYLPGPEISLEGCTVDGRFVPVAFTDKRIDDHFVEIGHQQPSELPAELLERAAKLAAESLAALGVDTGVTHSEFKLTPAGPVLVETHTRLGGDNIHLLTELTTGVDLADLMVGLALGERPAVEPHGGVQAAAIRWLLGPPGKLVALDLPSPDSRRGLVGSGRKARPGTVVGDRNSSSRQLAYVLAVGDSTAEAVARADRFAQEIHVEYAEALGPPPATAVTIAGEPALVGS